MSTGAWVAIVLLVVVIGQAVFYRRLKRQLEQKAGALARLERTLSFARKELAKVQTRRKRLLAASTQALMIVEKDRRISSANKVAKQLFGPLGKETTFIEWTRQHQLNELVDQTLQNQKMPPVYFAKDDKILEAHAKSIKFKGKMEAVALAIHDVTELQRLSRARRDFVANISHELRTPLASIRLLTDTLLTGALDDRDTALTMIDKIAAQTETLGQLARELLDLSLIESGQVPMRLAPSSLRAILQAQVDDLRPQAERKNLSLTIDLPEDITVLVDETMIGRVVTNLLHNAIKFTEKGGVTITAECCPAVERKGTIEGEEGEWVTVRVTDTGIGIPPDELGRIFERFYKIDRSRTRQQSGTGLGLAIARHIIEAHGGRIWAESSSNGATFVFTLPVEEAPVAAETQVELKDEL